MVAQARVEDGRRAGARGVLGRLALGAGSTLVSLALAELALRALGIAPARYAQAVHLESADKRVGLDLYPDDPRGYFPIDLGDGDERARWRARGLGEVDARWERTPHAVPFEYTAELCRGAAIPERADGRARVVVIGDSFTEGQGVREQDTFVARLDRTLAGAQVINCGRRGYDFPELAEWFDARLALEPDVVVYAMLLNDPQQSDAFHARQRYVDDWILDRRRMVSEGDGVPPVWESRLWALIDDRVEGARIGAETTRWYREMVGEPNREGWEATLAHVARMHETMRARGGRLLVALWPLLVELDGEYPFRDAHETIARAMRERGIPFVDGLETFVGHDPGELWVHACDRHPNERAHEMFARAVEGAVRAAIDETRPRS